MSSILYSRALRTPFQSLIVQNYGLMARDSLLHALCQILVIMNKIHSQVLVAYCESSSYDSTL